MRRPFARSPILAVDPRLAVDTPAVLTIPISRAIPKLHIQAELSPNDSRSDEDASSMWPSFVQSVVFVRAGVGRRVMDSLARMCDLGWPGRWGWFTTRRNRSSVG